MSSAQIAATYPLLAVLVFFGLKSGYAALRRWWQNRR
jgi:hypothetical protein